MLGKTFKKKINLKYYFFPPKPKEDILIARDILYAPTVDAPTIFPLHLGLNTLLLETGKWKLSSQQVSTQGSLPKKKRIVQC
jgi:hypothetical protein